MTCFPPCLMSFLSHHNHHHDILKNTKKQRQFFKKKKIGKEKKTKKRKNAKSQFWLRITRNVDATSRDFGCKFRLRRSPGASESVFGPMAVPFFSKKNDNWKEKRTKKQKKRKTSKSQFWLRIARKVNATGRDFGCKFRLRRSPGASESGFGLWTAPCLTIFCFFSFFFVLHTYCVL